MVNKMTYNNDEQIMDSIVSILNNKRSSLRTLNRKMWIGTMTDLSKLFLNNFGTKISPIALGKSLNRLAFRFRNYGVGVQFRRTTDHSRVRYVELMMQ
jgi:hypothetical protein